MESIMNMPTDEQNLHSRTVCRFYERGICRYGTNCRFLHPTNDETRNSIEQNNLNNINVDGNQSHPMNWVEAPEFIPNRFIKTNDDIDVAITSNQSINDTDNKNNISYAQIVSGNSNERSFKCNENILCPYLRRVPLENGYLCPYGETCTYLHGILCDICNQFCLHPNDENQRRNHQTECMELLEKDMQLSFAVAKSKDKTCGICFEIIIEKSKGEKRFGILPNCNHIFCLECIRKWRSAKNFHNTITRACPECRITSDFVCPSMFWVDSKEEKAILLDKYKEALGQQNCKYFKRGSGTCPFGNKCFYKHASPSGDLVDVGEPHQRRRINLNGEFEEMSDQILWDFLQFRDDDSSDDNNFFVYLSDTASETSDLILYL